MLSESQRAVIAARLRRGRAAMGTEAGDAGAAPGGNGEAGARGRARRITRRPAGLPEVPASFGQEQLWFIDRFAPGLGTYNLPQALRVSGPVDEQALGQAVAAMVARHEALRTRLVTGGDSRPVQVIDPPADLPPEVVDLTSLDAAARRARLDEFLAAETMRPFSLAEGPLWRAWLVRLEPGERVLVFVFHHAVFDGWSAGVLLRDLAALYEAEATGDAPAVPEMPVQFADYAVWERERLAGSLLAELEEYWRAAMAGFETVAFPTDRARPAVDSFSGGLAVRTMDAGLLVELRELSRQHGTTLFVTLMAALHVLVHRYTGQTDLVIGTVSANRGKSELTPLIAFLVNTLPIRADVSGDPSFTELLERVQRSVLGAFGHQDLPFGRLVETLGVERDASRAPVFQIALTYAEREARPVVAAGVEFAPSDLVGGIDAAKFDLTFAAEARPGGLWVECSYKTALFERATIERLLAHLEVLLRGVAGDPGARLSALPLLAPEELRRELAEWNDTAVPVPLGCVHRRFEEQVARTPEAVAAKFEGEEVTYAELNRWANQIARWLRGLGVGSESLAGVCMGTSLRRLAALLGIWKAGGGYVPLDPALPGERLEFMVTDAGMPVVVTDDAALASLPRTGARAVSLDAEWDRIAALPGDDLGEGAAPENVAYVIYTSGSTGRPKGVVVEHRHAVNFLHGMVAHWQVSGADAVLGFASLSFDVSVMDMFTALTGGATLVLASPETLHSPPRLAALMRSANVTFACLPPAVLSLLADEDFPSLRVLMAAGEELPAELARRWTRPGLRFVNGYGPTEATVIATYAELGEGMTPPPIGLPTWPNYRVYVLDPHLNPVPVGAAGELHIGGASVARGYLNRPELTRERFIPDPFTPGERLYKTGDLVRRRPDGKVVFLGRIDNQVKLHGLRIELGEIETALTTHPGVAQAVATITTGHTGSKHLTAYVRPRPAAQPSAADLRAHLARTVPAAMIPAYLVTVEEFPLNNSGKIDKRALPAPVAQAVTGYLAPATATETIMADLYAGLLGRERVSVTGSFFDLGGNSLSAMRLVDMIHSATGVDVGVTSVFVHPTPRQLAATVDAVASGAAAQAGERPVVALSRGTGELPLFMIHPIGGTVSAYTPLASELSGRFGVHGLQAPGLAESGTTPESLADLVDEYTRLVVAAQPDGPYRLAGWSMGGVVAFEIARRLEQSGAHVSMLALLDAPFTIPADWLPGRDQLAGRFVADAVAGLGWQTAPPDPAAASAGEQIGWLAGRLGAGDDEPGREAMTGRLWRRFGVFEAHTRMLAGYQPRRPAVHAPALIVSASGSPNAPARSHWPSVLAGQVMGQSVDSDHYAFLRAPLVAEVGTAILKWHGDLDDRA
jgi:amino acid adenylation domain-containing protein